MTDARGELLALRGGLKAMLALFDDEGNMTATFVEMQNAINEGYEILGHTKPSYAAPVPQCVVAWRFRWPDRDDDLWETVSSENLLPTNRDGWEIEPLYAIPPSRADAGSEYERFVAHEDCLNCTCDNDSLCAGTQPRRSALVSPPSGREAIKAKLAELFHEHIRLVAVDPDNEQTLWKVKPASKEKFLDAAILALSPDPGTVLDQGTSETPEQRSGQPSAENDAT